MLYKKAFETAEKYGHMYRDIWPIDFTSMWDNGSFLDEEILEAIADTRETFETGERILSGLMGAVKGDYLTIFGFLPEQCHMVELEKHTYICKHPAHNKPRIRIERGKKRSKSRERLLGTRGEVINPREIAVFVVPEGDYSISESHGALLYLPKNEKKGVFFSMDDVLGDKGEVKCPYCHTGSSLVREVSHLTLVYRIKPDLEGLTRDLGVRVNRSELEWALSDAHIFPIYMHALNGDVPLEVLLRRKVSNRPLNREERLDKLKLRVIRRYAPDVVFESRLKRNVPDKYFLAKYVNRKKKLWDHLGFRVLFPTDSDVGRFVYHFALLSSNWDVKRADVKNFFDRPKSSGYRGVHFRGKLNRDFLDGLGGISEDQLKQWLAWKCVELQGRTFEQDFMANTDPRQRHDLFKTRTTEREVVNFAVGHPDKAIEYAFLRSIFDAAN